MMTMYIIDQDWLLSSLAKKKAGWKYDIHTIQRPFPIYGSNP